MSLTARVPGYNNICGITIDTTGVTAAANVDYLDGFHDSLTAGATRTQLYYGYKSIRFRESSERTAAGTSYTQEMQFHFPNHDHQAVTRIATLEKTKNIFLKNSHGQELLMGRNDHKQNRPPVMTSQTGPQLTTITFTTRSMFKIGFSDQHLTAGLPHDVPVFLFE